MDSCIVDLNGAEEVFRKVARYEVIEEVDANGKWTYSINQENPIGLSSQSEVEASEPGEDGKVAAVETGVFDEVVPRRSLEEVVGGFRSEGASSDYRWSFVSSQASNQSSVDMVEDPLSVESLKSLSSAMTGSEAPQYAFVEGWFVSMRQKPCHLLAVVLVLDWGISAVLSATGLFVAWLYHSLFDWDQHFEAGAMLGLLGGLFTGWNIAQYASYAIQTTGHFTLRQHFRATSQALKALLPCNLFGWAMALLVLWTPMKDLPMKLKILVVAGPPIALGISSKTMLKLTYLRNEQMQQDSDAFRKRLQAEEVSMGQKLECPFKAISCRIFSRHLAGPFTCFLWTVVYVILLTMAQRWVLELDDPAHSILQFVLFVLSLVAMATGMGLLLRWVQSSHGFFGYSDQMLVAFVVIYTLVSDVQVRLSIVKMTGWLRPVCTFIQPLYFTLLRFRLTRSWTHSVTRVREGRPARHEPLLVISCMGLVVCQNVSSVLLAGTTCIFQDKSMFELGICEYGLFGQIVRDAAITWAFDSLSIALWIKDGMPVLYFFSILDPFLVIAAILVVYMCTILTLLTGTVH